MHALTQSPLLRFALRLDGVVSSAAGVATCSQFASLSAVLGAPAEVVLRIGAFMLIYGVTIGWISTRAQVDQRLAWFVAVGNLIWANVSMLLTASDRIAPNTLGVALILGQALIVAGIAALQYLGLRRSRELALA